MAADNAPRKTVEIMGGASYRLCMIELPREARLNQLAVSLVNTLTEEYDLDDLLETLVAECKDLLDVTEVGLVLADPRATCT